MKQLQCLCFYLFSKDYRYVNITELLILFIHLARLCVLFFPYFAQLALCPFFLSNFSISFPLSFFLSSCYIPAEETAPVPSTSPSIVLSDDSPKGHE